MNKKPSWKDRRLQVLKSRIEMYLFEKYHGKLNKITHNTNYYMFPTFSCKKKKLLGANLRQP